MVREDEILYILSQDSWFIPSRKANKKQLKNADGTPMIDENGKEIEVAESYYKTLHNGTQLLIRVSNHGTDLDTWVRHNPDPTLSLQNASIVFSNGISSPKLKTYPHKYIDENGNEVEGYRYFVVEEFEYNISNFDLKSVRKIINSIKNIEHFDAESEPMFQDPFENNPRKRAGVRVLTPQDSDGKDLPSATNPIHSRQEKVAINPYSKVDSKGEIIKENISKIRISDIRYIISECVSRLYEIQRKKRVGKYTAIDGDWWDGIPKGLESKDCGLQDVRMYDYKDETIALWRRCDNLKYFYAKIVPDKGKETKWQAMKLSEVPIVIRNDFSTINPSGHEPYLPF